MSFYNVTNPTSFSVVSDTRKMLTQQGKLVRSAAITALNPYSNSGNGTSSTAPITPEQLIQGNLFVNPSGTANFFLPKAADLIQLLMGPGGFDVSSNDIFTFRIFNINATNTLTVKVNAASGETNTGSDIAITPGVNKPINLQITITVSGSGTTYSYAMF